jgi:hypothetical protein
MSVLKWLGIVTGAFSLLALYQAGFDAPPFAPFLQLILDFDSEIKRYIFKSIEPLLTELTRRFNEWTGWRLELYPYWKHIVVLLWLYFGGGARLAWRQNDKAGAIFRVVWGGLIAVPAGAAFGLVPMESTAAAAFAQELDRIGVHVGGRVGLNLLSVLFPVTAIVAFALGIAAWVATHFDRRGQTWFATFIGHARTYPLMYAFVGFASVLVALMANSAPPLQSLIATLPNPGLLLLLALIVALAVFLFWSDRDLDLDNNLGATILQSLFGSLGFIFADAAWKLMT